MADEENYDDYVSLAKYCRERGINQLYLRGALYALGVELPLVAGTVLVSPKLRTTIDPITDRIKRRMRGAGPFRSRSTAASN